MAGYFSDLIEEEKPKGTGYFGDLVEEEETPPSPQAFDPKQAERQYLQDLLGFKSPKEARQIASEEKEGIEANPAVGNPLEYFAGPGAATFKLTRALGGATVGQALGKGAIAGAVNIPSSFATDPLARKISENTGIPEIIPSMALGTGVGMTVGQKLEDAVYKLLTKRGVKNPTPEQVADLADQITKGYQKTKGLEPVSKSAFESAQVFEEEAAKPRSAAESARAYELAIARGEMPEVTRTLEIERRLNEIVNELGRTSDRQTIDGLHGELQKLHGEYEKLRSITYPESPEGLKSPDFPMTRGDTGELNRPVPNPFRDEGMPGRAPTEADLVAMGENVSSNTPTPVMRPGSPEGTSAPPFPHVTGEPMTQPVVTPSVRQTNHFADLVEPEPPLPPPPVRTYDSFPRVQGEAGSLQTRSGYFADLFGDEMDMVPPEARANMRLFQEVNARGPVVRPEAPVPQAPVPQPPVPPPVPPPVVEPPPVVTAVVAQEIAPKPVVAHEVPVGETQTQPQNLVDRLANVIKQKESGGRYDAREAGGRGPGVGAYQFTGTWGPWSRAYAKAKGLGHGALEMTPENQDAVAKWVIQGWLDKGMTPEQVFAAWNAGERSALSGKWKTKVGTNKHGLKYDTPSYVDDAMRRFAGAEATAPVSTVSEMVPPVKTPEAPISQAVKEDLVPNGTPASKLTDSTRVNGLTMGEIEQAIMKGSRNIHEELASILDGRLKQAVEMGADATADPVATFQDWMNPMKVGSRIFKKLMDEGRYTAKQAKEKTVEMLGDYEAKYNDVLAAHREGRLQELLPGQKVEAPAPVKKVKAEPPTKQPLSPEMSQKITGHTFSSPKAAELFLDQLRKRNVELPPAKMIGKGKNWKVKFMDRLSDQGGYVNVGDIADALMSARSRAGEIGGKAWNALKEWSMPTSTMPGSDQYLDIRGEARGWQQMAKDLASGIYKETKQFPHTVREMIFDYLDGKTSLYDLQKNLTPEELDAAKRIRFNYDLAGQMLVDRGMMKQETYDAMKGQYIPYRYLKHMVENDETYSGGGARIETPFLKQRNPDLDDITRKEMGLVKDVSIAGPVGLYDEFSAIGAHDFYKKIDANPEWVWQNNLVDLGDGQKVTVGNLQKEIENLRKMVAIDPYSVPMSAKLARLEQAMQGASDASGHTPGPGWKKMPDTGYGPLSGKYVREEIYHDIMPVMEVNTDSSAWKKLLDLEGKVMTGFKAAKTSLNIPISYARNAISNVVQLNMSGIPLQKIPGYLKKAVTSMRGEDDIFTQAKMKGLFTGNFVEGELDDIYREFDRLQGKRGTMAEIFAAVGKVGKYYGKIDDVFKLAKVHEQLESGADWGTAVREAQKWGMDYSLAAPSVKMARRHAIPFASYAYKIAPLVVETAKERPLTLAKYFAIPALMEEAVKAKYKMSDKEWEKTKRDAPEYVRDRPFMVPLPSKSPEGNIQWMDLSYFLPFGNMAQLWSDLKKGKISESIQDIGLGNPALDAYMAVKQGKEGRAPVDPFTGSEIYNPLDTTGDKWKKMALWTGGYFMPPVIQDHGFAGYMRRAQSGEKDKWGRQVTMPQALARAVGVNIIAPTRAQGAIEKKYAVNQLKSDLLNAIRKDPNMDKAERSRLMSEFQRRVKEVTRGE